MGIAFLSQGIVVKQAAGFTDKNPAQQAGELSKVLLGEPLSSDDSYVVGQAGEAEALAQQLGFRCFCPGVTANQGAAGSVAVDWAAFSRQLCLLPRISQVQRHSNETKIDIRLDLDSPDRHINVKTGMGFFDHMLEQVAKHGGFSMDLQCEGDLHIDEHHTVEDCALALGQALREALGDKRGIDRYGFVLPMDEAEVQVSMDLSARPYFVFNGAFTRDRVGDLSTEMVPHFFKSLSDTLGASLHITMTGDNAHHQVEAMFKGVGRTLKQAINVWAVRLW